MNAAKEEIVSTLSTAGRPRRRVWLWLIVLVALAAAGAVGIRSRRAEAPVYVTDAVREAPLRVTVTATGTLQPTNQVDVGSEISGIIDRVFVDFNDNVTQGQIIAQLDTQTLEARAASTRASLAVAEASLAQAQATVTEARAKAARSRELAARNIASQQTLETDEAAAQRAVAAVASATAQVTVSTATLRESETALRKAVIRAPIDGVIISREIGPARRSRPRFRRRCCSSSPATCGTWSFTWTSTSPTSVRCARANTRSFASTRIPVARSKRGSCPCASTRERSTTS